MRTNTPDRRRLLAGLALAPAAAVAAAPALARASDADAELIALGRRHAELAARSEALWSQDALALAGQAETADRELWAVERQIFATRAATLPGLRVKASIAAGVLGDEPDGTYEDHLVRNLLADLADARP